jgi:hypothetical protein
MMSGGASESLPGLTHFPRGATLTELTVLGWHGGGAEHLVRLWQGGGGSLSTVHQREQEREKELLAGVKLLRISWVRAIMGELMG